MGKRDHMQVIDAAIERGWSVCSTRNGHLKLLHPSGAIYFTSSTPSDRRASMNLDHDLRRIERQVAS